MTKKIIAAAILIIFFSSSQTLLAGKDGNFWRKLTKLEKLVYLNGLLDGFMGGDFFVPENGIRGNLEYHAKLEGIFGSAGVQNMSDGLDEFYSDFKNRDIAIYRAITVVAGQINGMPDEKVRALIEMLRQKKAQ